MMFPLPAGDRHHAGVFWGGSQVISPGVVGAAAPRLKGGLSMTLTKQHKSIAGILVLLLGAFVPAARATTILPGVLYFSTFQNQGGARGALTTNVWSIPSVYEITSALCLGASEPESHY